MFCAHWSSASRSDEPISPLSFASVRALGRQTPISIFRKIVGNVYMHMRDALGTIYQDESFAHLFPQNGRPVEARLSAGIHYRGAVHRGTARSTSRRCGARTD